VSPKDSNLAWIVVGAGNQGSKHIAALKKNCIGVIDTPNLREGLAALQTLAKKGARNIIIATPEHVKTDYVIESMSLKLNIAIEKPLPLEENLYNHIHQYLQQGYKFQTMYDHLTDSLISQAIVEIRQKINEFQEWTSFSAEYGFGTRNIIQRSPWMDFGTGPWELVSPHILKIAAETGLLDESKMDFGFGFGGLNAPTEVIASKGGRNFLTLDTSYISWKNTFRMVFRYERGLVELNGLEKWGNGILKFYEMDFNENYPLLVRHVRSSRKISYVERIHRQLFDIDLFESLKHDNLIWKHIWDARSSLYSI
jgi:predicted dehydrogenase